MKALTVQQPWAWAILHGGKDVENRTQAWTHRGPLAIHAGGRWSERGAEFEPLQQAYAEWLGFDHWHGWDGGRTAMPIDPTSDRDRELIDFGAIVGVVDLVDVHMAEPEYLKDGLGTPACCDSLWAEQEYVEHGGRTRRQLVHLVVGDPRPLDVPVPCRGSLGLWTLPPEVRDVVLEQLVEVSA